MARRKSSRGRVFYYPSSLPKMRDEGDTNQQNDEYTTTLDLISTYKGYNPSAMKEVLNKIAWHETGMTLNPKQLQGNDPTKPGKGLYQFEKDSLATAIQSAKNFYKSTGEPVPDWINNLNTTDATTLSASQQSSLAALSIVQKKNFPVRQALENEEGLVEAWSKGWQTKNNPAKKALFKEHLEIYKDKGIKTELPTVTSLDPIGGLPIFQNSSRIGNGTKDTEKDPATGLPKLKKGGNIQKQGYKDNSPYKNRPYIDIYSNNITMDGVSQPLLVKADTGQEMILDPNSGEYYFPGANVVREMPLRDTPLYFSPSSKGLTKYQTGGGGILSEPVSGDIHTTLTPEVNITGFKNNSYSFKGLPTISKESLQSGKRCSAKGCAEQATTEFATIVGTSREDIYPLVGTDAWYRKSKVLSNPNNELIFEAETADYDGYKNLPVKPKDDWWKNLDFQVGDFVDLSGKIVGDWRSSKQPKIGKASKDGHSQSDFSRHSGIIIGKTPEGIPIVRHNIKYILHDEPINNIREKYNYFVSAAYRVNDPVLDKGKNNYAIKKQQIYENISNYSDESLNLGFTGSVVDDKGNVLKVNTKKVKNKLVEPYKEIRKDLVVKYGVPQERLDDVFKSLLAIGTQESNLDNMVDDSFKSKAKVVVLDILQDQDIKTLKQLSNVKGAIENLASDYEVAKVPTWKLDKEIALLETQGVSREEAKHQIFSQYGAPSKTDKVTDKSKGPFRQKAPSGRWLNTMGEEYSTIEAMKKANWGKEWDDSNKNFIANAIGLYLDNYDKAKELYGENESEEFLNQVATLAHNAPTKAFTKEYTDFYIKGIDNPDLEEYNAGYVNKVYKAKESMFIQPGSPRVDNKGTHQGFIDKSAESSTQQQNANTPLVDIPSYFSGGKVNLTKYQPGGSLPKAQVGTAIDDTPDKADSEVYRLYLSGKHLRQAYPNAEQSGTGRLYPDAKEVSPNFEYEGDKHFNTKRFAYAPFFGKTETHGYHYRTNDEGDQAPLVLPKGDKARKKMLTDDMTTYFKASGYSDKEANQQAKNYVKKEVMPLVNSKWDKQRDKGNWSIGRVDQFNAPQLYKYVNSKGETKLSNLYRSKKDTKNSEEGYIQSPMKLKRLDKDFNIKFRGLSKKAAKTEAKFNYNNYKNERFTGAEFKADQKSGLLPKAKYNKGMPKKFKYGGGTGDGTIASTVASPVASPVISPVVSSIKKENVVTDFIDNNAGNLLTKKGAIDVINNQSNYTAEEVRAAIVYVGTLYPTADRIITTPGLRGTKDVPKFKDGGQLPKAQFGEKISKLYNKTKDAISEDLDYVERIANTLPQYLNPKTYNYSKEEGLDSIPNYNKYNSFGEAFKQAREDLGRGQTFLYNGTRHTTTKENEFPSDESERVFNTMTKTLSPEQKNKAKEYYFKQGAPYLSLGADDAKFNILPNANVSFSDLSDMSDRAHVNPVGPYNKVYLNTKNSTGKTSYDPDVSLLVEELAHIEQVRDKGTGPFFKHFLFDAVVGELQKKSTYETKGAIEYDAHEVIGPKRLEEIMDEGFKVLYDPEIGMTSVTIPEVVVHGDATPLVRHEGQLPKAEIMVDPATGLPKLKKGGKAWIQGAIKKPGSLKATAKGAGAMKSDGTIKKSWLREKAKGSGKTAQRARLAITLGKMKK
jgi:hypothetical protein